MVSSTLIQLFAKGPIDKVMYGNPQVTFFKCVYKRPMNFATQYIYKNSNQRVDWGKTVTFKIPKEGDLLGGVYLRINLSDLKRKYKYHIARTATIQTGTGTNVINPAESGLDDFNFDVFFESSISNNKTDPTVNGFYEYLNNMDLNSGTAVSDTENDIKFTSFVNGIGSRIIENVSLYSGNTLLEKIPGEWVFVENELHNNDNSKKMLYDSIKYKNDTFIIGADGDNIMDMDLVIPIPFFFTKDTGLHLPILAIHNELEVRVKLRELSECIIHSYSDLQDWNAPLISTAVEYDYVNADDLTIKFARFSDTALTTYNAFSNTYSSQLPNSYTLSQDIITLVNDTTVSQQIKDNIISILGLNDTENYNLSIQNLDITGTNNKYPIGMISFYDLKTLKNSYLSLYEIYTNNSILQNTIVETLLKRMSFTLFDSLVRRTEIQGINGQRTISKDPNTTWSYGNLANERIFKPCGSIFDAGTVTNNKKQMVLPSGLRFPLEKRDEDAVSTINSMDIIYKYFHIDQTQKIQFLSRRNTYIVPIIKEIAEDKFDYVDGSVQQIPLELRNPVRYIVFLLQREKNMNDGDVFNFTKLHTLSKNKYSDFDGGNQNELADTQINNILDEFNLSVENVDILDGIPSKVLNNIEFYTKFRNSSNPLIYVYSFAIFPNEINPSGSLNFSQVKDQFIKLKLHSNLGQNNLDSSINEKLIFRGYYSSYNILTIDEGLVGYRFY